MLTIPRLMAGAQLEARLTPGPEEATLAASGCLFTFPFSWIVTPRKPSHALIFKVWSLGLLENREGSINFKINTLCWLYFIT